jgi:hypothetical protein
MTAPIHYALPIVDPHAAMRVAVVALWGWPVLVTGTVAAVRWSRLRSRVGFLALGYLTCVGISALAPRIGGWFLWVYMVPAVPQDQLVAVAVNESIGATIAGIILSVIPALWLAKLLELRRAII